MNDAQRPAGCVRFGAFEFNPQIGQLLKRGLKIKLSGQPIELLAMLLERPGQLVTREDLQKRLWPHDTVVEFEHSINAAINRLREALSDSADEPRYVETLPRRGYRFIYPLSGVERGRVVAPPPPPAPPAKAAPPSSADFTHSDLIGRTVSHYRILERLGGGGMGIVYKAEDTRLGRKVALKFLPTGLATNPTALARFQREARAASALNHPHICTVYEVDEVEGQPFLAMELMEGQTLKERLGRAGLGPARREREARPYQSTRCSIWPSDCRCAGSRARRGHRASRHQTGEHLCDEAGRCQDPGLRAGEVPGRGDRGSGPRNRPISGGQPAPPGGEGAERSEAGEGAPPHDTPTLSIDREDLTIPGTTVGTVAYMSPEQARGEKLDARTDLFSFGAVLYEMATGRQAFTGATSGEIREAILTRQPTPPQRLNPALNPRLQAIIEKALEKDCDVRYQHASDIRADLRRLKRETDADRAVAPGLSPAHIDVAAGLPRHADSGGVKPPLRPRLAIALAGAVVIAGAILVYWLTRPPAPPPQLKETRLTFNPRENAVNQADISPDGKYLAYSDQKGLHLKLIPTGEILNIPQPEDPAADRADWWPNGWFPDGTQVDCLRIPGRISRKRLGCFRDGRTCLVSFAMVLPAPGPFPRTAP